MPELPDFARVLGQLSFDRLQPGYSLLIGNGVSVNIWPSFGYASLYEVALSDRIPSPLGAAERRLFDRLGTNFERVLALLSQAEPLFRALGEEDAADRTRASHDLIRQALVHAVRAVHPEWEQLVGRPDVCSAVGDALADYTRIYSTNYDVLIYWAILQKNTDAGRDVFMDAFFGDRTDEDTLEFSISNARVANAVSLVLYPHGALHLLREFDGATHKVCYAAGTRILDRFGEVMIDRAEPLMVTEGEGASKRASIEQTGYLAHCLAEMGRDGRPMVILEHSLGDSDSHLVEAIADRPFARDFAVGIYPGGADVAEQVERFERILNPRGNHRLFFFDSRTHPLTLPALRL